MMGLFQAEQISLGMRWPGGLCHEGSVTSNQLFIKWFLCYRQGLGNRENVAAGGPRFLADHYQMALGRVSEATADCSTRGEQYQQGGDGVHRASRMILIM